jgi:hypothetical protein
MARSTAGMPPSAARPSCHVTTAIKATEATPAPSRKPAAHRGRRTPGNHGPTGQPGRTTGGRSRRWRGSPPGGPSHQIADERGRGQDRTGSDLTEGDRVEALPVRQPAGADHQIGPPEGEEDRAAPEQDRADLEEGQPEGHKVDGRRGREESGPENPRRGGGAAGNPPPDCAGRQGGAEPEQDLVHPAEREGRPPRS